ncbi:Heme-binding protein 2 like protein [Argiope bruennichi]|uniref:Heme-binding protein 2 like protein n=2 Tax=Argiope bruennichi TaxID=94029 RepID=A0A8T0DXD5_ARGBR|nr:Heme-binding protein 2 like protein [Argiope bruennichi]
MWRVVSVILCAFTIESCVYKNFECAPFTVVEKRANYMILSFPALTWATTTGIDPLPLIAEYKAFQKLLRYVRGKNDRRQEINMTLPFRIKTTPGKGEVILEMSWMIPKTLADNPPIPRDKNITLHKEGPRMYAMKYIRRVRRRSALDEEAEVLRSSALDDDTIDKTEFYIASYDGPYALTDIEIWMKKTAA